MIKLGYVAPKKGGKTQFLITMIQEEFSQGHRCFYLGGEKHYKEIVQKIAKAGCSAKLELITKDVMPSENNCAVFTDNLTWEMTNIFPYAIRAMIKLDCNWYYTLPKEEQVIVDLPTDDCDNKEN